ncbi:MAG: ComEC family competence protein [Bacteroidales bacterium]|nr:ComEC family competence protein [Bacteroidales bacterium]
MNHWHQYPFVRIIIPFIAGIWLADYLNAYSLLLNWAIILLLCFSGFFIFFPAIFQLYRHRHYFGLLSSFVLMLMSFQITSLQINKSQEDIPKIPFQEKKNILVKVLDQVVEKKNSYQVKAKMVLLKDSLKYQNTDLNVIMYDEKSGKASNIRSGDYLFSTCILNRIRNADNPHDFNYQQYMARKGFYAQCYAGKDQYTIIKKGNQNIIKQNIRKIRKHILKSLKGKKQDAKEYSLAAAIILGFDEDLDPETRASFAGAGAMHILCVSGLHVGIIYLFFSSLLGFFKKFKHGNLLRSILVIMIIWLYAAITGFSPSVLRAASMFSFVAAGKMIRRQSYIYNTLAASAFLILLIDPMSLFSVGFQLSYTAVFFIVWLQPVFYRLFYFSHWLPDRAWAIVTVSVAATMGTFPISLYYFHLFPNYFMLTNLVVIPLSFLIVFNGILLILFSFFEIGQIVFSFSLKFMIISLHKSVAFIESIPGSTFRDVYLSETELFFLYVIMMLFFTMIIQRNYKLIKYAMSILLLVLLYNTLNKFSEISQAEMIAYNINKGMGVDFIQGKQHFFLTDSSTLRNTSGLNYAVKENWVARKLELARFIMTNQDFSSDNLHKKGNFLIFKNKLFLLLEKKADCLLPHSLQIDCVLLLNNLRMSLKEIDSLLSPRKIVITSKISDYAFSRYTTESTATGSTILDGRHKAIMVKLD